MRHIHHISHPAIFISFGPQKTTWSSIRIGWGSIGSGSWLTGVVNRRLLSVRNLYLNGTLVAVLRSWWDLHYRLVSSYCICFCSKSLYTIFPVSVWMSLVRVQSIVILGELPRRERRHAFWISIFYHQDKVMHAFRHWIHYVKYWRALVARD